MTFQTDDVTLTTTVTNYDDSDPTVVIPDTITHNGNVYAVTTIGDGAFSFTNLTTVAIPDSVTTIGVSAFESAPLTTVTLGNSVTTIDRYAFYDTNLTDVALPGSVTTIDRFAFMYTNLTTITIPDLVTTVGNGAFSNTNLTSVTIGNSVTTIGNEAFFVTNLTTITVPGSVTTIGVRAFPPTLTSAVFQGAPPSGFTANGPNGSLGGGPTSLAYYPSAFAADYAPGGATTWQGYNTAVGATLSYDLGGHGAAIDGVTVIPGGSVAAPTAPTATGYTFEGWFTANAGGAAFDFAGALASDTTAFARWTAISAPAASPTLPVMGFDGTALTTISTLLLVLGASALAFARTSRRRAPANHR